MFEYENRVLQKYGKLHLICTLRAAITKGFLSERALDLKGFQTEIQSEKKRSMMDEPSDLPLSILTPVKSQCRRPPRPRLKTVNSSV